MDYKDFFENLGITTIDSCFRFLYNILFGWKDIYGIIHKGVNDATLYTLQSPEELAQSGVGICWDVVEFARLFFQTMTAYYYETFYIMYDDDKGCPSHTFLVFEKDDKMFLFEPTAHHCSYQFSGIIEFENKRELLSFVMDAVIKNFIGNGSIPFKYDKNKILLYKYSQPAYHLNGHEIRQHINNSERIEINYDRKFI